MWRRTVYQHDDMASRGPSALRRMVLCTMHNDVASRVPLHDLASLGLLARRGVEWSLCTTWHHVVYQHHAMSHAPSARCGIALARSFVTCSISTKTWHRMDPQHHVASCGFSAQCTTTWRRVEPLICSQLVARPRRVAPFSQRNTSSNISGQLIYFRDVDGRRTEHSTADRHPTPI